MIIKNALRSDMLPQISVKLIFSLSSIYEIIPEAGFLFKYLKILEQDEFDKVFQIKIQI